MYLCSTSSLWFPGYGDGLFIRFRSVDANPFVYRQGTANGAKDDNQLFALSDFRSSDPLLSAWVAEADSAWLCIGNTAAGESAWALIPVSNNEWSSGCNGGNWQGKGAYYGDAGYGAGWVGSKGNGEEKAVTGPSVNLGLKIKVCEAGKRLRATGGPVFLSFDRRLHLGLTMGPSLHLVHACAQTDQSMYRDSISVKIGTMLAS